jgi:hypothetical protein
VLRLVCVRPTTPMPRYHDATGPMSITMTSALQFPQNAWAGAYVRQRVIDAKNIGTARETPV